MSRRKHQFGPNLVLVLATFLALSIVSEIGLHWLAPVANPYDSIDHLRPHVNQYIRFEYPRDYAAVTVAEPGLSGITGHNHFTTDNMGFRGDSLITPKPRGEFRIFIVGGSTTECFYVDDANDMSRVVQNDLAAQAPDSTTVKVYNVGMSGAASDDHVAMISQRLVLLQPDMIVVFCGINDLTRSIYDYDYLHYVDIRPEPWQRCLKHVIMESQLVRRAYYLRQRIHKDPRRMLEERLLETNYAGLVGLQRTLPVTDKRPRTDETSYRDNLVSMVGLARAHGVRLVFMTQQSTWNSHVDPHARDWSWMRNRTGVTYREDYMDAALESLNDVMRGVAAGNDVPVFDLARTMPKSLKYFYDDCHFNTEGSITAGHELAKMLVSRSLVPTTPAATGR